ncbi:MAG: hypothetical protein U0P45_10005 [Acidimicrobiales bacterium]
MEPLEAAIASGDSVNGLGSHFMLDMGTYAYGNELGFAGMDFYIGGRGGPLGDVPGGVVAAAFVFLAPTFVAESWKRAGEVMPRAKAAAEFAGVGHRWAEDRLPDDIDAGRLADLAGTMIAAASPACAPLFAGWIAMSEPSRDRPKALALHRINALRELRGAMHGAAVIAQGIHPQAAVARRTPFMLGIFGWPEPHPDGGDVRDDWKAAQAATERAMAPAYEALTPAERGEFVELVNAAQSAIVAANG